MWQLSFVPGAPLVLLRAAEKHPLAIGMPLTEKPGTIFGRVLLCSLYNHYLFTTSSDREL